MRDVRCASHLLIYFLHETINTCSSNLIERGDGKSTATLKLKEPNSESVVYFFV